MQLEAILKSAVDGGASDIHFKVGLPPVLRVHGHLYPFSQCKPLSRDQIMGFIDQMMTPLLKEHFAANWDADFAKGFGQQGRFRVNCFMSKGNPGIVMRHIPQVTKTIVDLMLPRVLETIAAEPRGLILVTGATGSGKSTTLAAMVDHINRHKTCHIVTIEDPIEYVFGDNHSIITQREIGIDATSFSSALRAALRQDPDVIMVGEMRDLDTVEISMRAANTGHLVLSTLHTVDAQETIHRIVQMFPPHQQRGVYYQLGGMLKAIISQRLMPTVDGTGRVAGVEVLRVTSRIKELIESEERVSEIRDAMAQGTVAYGMQTFDQSLMQLYRANLISVETALEQATNPDDFKLRVAGVVSDSDRTWQQFDNDGAGAGQAQGGAGAPGGGSSAPDAPSNDPGFEIDRF